MAWAVVISERRLEDAEVRREEDIEADLWRVGEGRRVPDGPEGYRAAGVVGVVGDGVL